MYVQSAMCQLYKLMGLHRALHGKNVDVCPKRNVQAQVQATGLEKHLVSEDAALTHRGQQKVVWQELQSPDSHMVLQLYDILNSA